MYDRFKGRVYSVGDGFCYEGIIKENTSNSYHFVIDCGSQAPKNRKQKVGELSSTTECNSRLKEITDEIVSNGDHIDLFILTHLHVDHYNGIKMLFQSGIPDMIIMPYLYPEERLCLIINNDMDDDDSLFLADPYTTVLNLAKESNPDAKLILFRGNVDNVDDDDLDDRQTDDSIVWGVPYEDSEYVLEVEDIRLSDAEVVSVTQKNIEIFDGIWVFKFFNLEIDKADIDVLKKIVGKLTAKHLYNNIASLKKQYKKIAKNLFNDFNNTSIVTYHAPFHNYSRCGTLITGDIDLNHNIVDSILDYFNNEMDKIGLFSIPHHGSKANWNKKLIDSGVLKSSICFASTHNYYSNRMMPDMMSDLRCQNICALVVDENRFSEIEQIIDNSYSPYILNKSHKNYKIEALLGKEPVRMIIIRP